MPKGSSSLQWKQKLGTIGKWVEKFWVSDPKNNYLELQWQW